MPKKKNLKNKKESTLKNKKESILKNTKKHPGGRPSKYNKEFHPKLIEILARLGKTDKEMCKELGISEPTLHEWKKKHKEFLKSIKKGKEEPNKKIERSLYKRAFGFTHPETKVFCFNGKIITKEVPKYYPPETKACAIWLFNRMPERWKYKQEVELALPEEMVNIVKSMFSKKNKKIKEE